MVKELASRDLRYTCDPQTFRFDTTAQLEPLNRIIGQERAVEALKLGLGIKDAKNRYNIYVAGGPGTGKMSAVKHFLSRASADEPQPPDVCYVHNFENPYSPRYLELPPGKGCQLRTDLEQHIKRLQREIPKVFETDEFKARSKKISDRFGEQRTTMLEKMEQQAKELGFAIQRTPIGINTLPLHETGEPLSQEEYEAYLGQLRPVDFAAVYDGDRGLEALGEAYCSTDVCELPSLRTPGAAEFEDSDSDAGRAPTARPSAS